MIPELPYKHLKGSPEKNTVHSRNKGPVIPAVGSLYNSNGALPYNPSYSKISNEVILPDPDNYLVKHKIEISPLMDVIFNGHCIASAPARKINAKGKEIARTQAERLKFCRAVIWSIIPSETRVYQKDSNGKMGTQSIPDDVELRRYAALYPALIDNQMDDVKEEMLDKLSIAALPSIIAAPEPIAVSAPMVPVIEDLVLPEYMSAYTHEGITGYPEVKDNRDYGLNSAEMVDLIEMNTDIGEIESGYDYPEYDNVMTEFNTPAIEEIYEILNPVFIPEKVIVQNPLKVIRSWMHGRMMISEEVRA